MRNHSHPSYRLRERLPSNNMLAWVGGSKRRLRSSLKKKPRVEGITIQSAEHDEWKSQRKACSMLGASRPPGKEEPALVSTKGQQLTIGMGRTRHQHDGHANPSDHQVHRSSDYPADMSLDMLLFGSPKRKRPCTPRGADVPCSSAHKHAFVNNAESMDSLDADQAGSLHSEPNTPTSPPSMCISDVNSPAALDAEGGADQTLSQTAPCNSPGNLEPPLATAGTAVAEKYVASHQPDAPELCQSHRYSLPRKSLYNSAATIQGLINEIPCQQRSVDDAWECSTGIQYSDACLPRISQQADPPPVLQSQSRAVEHVEPPKPLICNPRDSIMRPHNARPETKCAHSTSKTLSKLSSLLERSRSILGVHSKTQVQLPSNSTPSQPVDSTVDANPTSEIRTDLCTNSSFDVTRRTTSPNDSSYDIPPWPCLPSPSAAQQLLPAVVSGGHVTLVPAFEAAKQCETGYAWRSGTAVARKQTGHAGSASMVLRRMRQELLSGLAKPAATPSCHTHSQAVDPSNASPGGGRSQAMKFTGPSLQTAASGTKCRGPKAEDETLVVNWQACAANNTSEAQPVCALAGAACADGLEVGNSVCRDQHETGKTVKMKYGSIRNSKDVSKSKDMLTFEMGPGRRHSDPHGPCADVSHNQVPACLPSNTSSAELGTADVDHAAAGTTPEFSPVSNAKVEEEAPGKAGCEGIPAGDEHAGRKDECAVESTVKAGTHVWGAAAANSSAADHATAKDRADSAGDAHTAGAAGDGHGNEEDGNGPADYGNATADGGNAAAEDGIETAEDASADDGKIAGHGEIGEDVELPHTGNTVPALEGCGASSVNGNACRQYRFPIARMQPAAAAASWLNEESAVMNARAVARDMQGAGTGPTAQPRARDVQVRPGPAGVQTEGRKQQDDLVEAHGAVVDVKRCADGSLTAGEDEWRGCLKMCSTSDPHVVDIQTKHKLGEGVADESVHEVQCDTGVVTTSPRHLLESYAAGRRKSAVGVSSQEGVAVRGGAALLHSSDGVTAEMTRPGRLAAAAAPVASCLTAAPICQRPSYPMNEAAWTGARAERLQHSLEKAIRVDRACTQVQDGNDGDPPADTVGVDYTAAVMYTQGFVDDLELSE